MQEDKYVRVKALLSVQLIVIARSARRTRVLVSNPLITNPNALETAFHNVFIFGILRAHLEKCDPSLGRRAQ